jgi:hypothetical protein
MALNRTSLDDTAGNAVAVGELVLLRVVCTLPELTMNLSVSVELASGLTEWNSSVSYVAASIAHGAIEKVDNGESSTTVAYEFGSIVNRFNESSGGADEIVIDVWAVVEDVSSITKG